MNPEGSGTRNIRQTSHVEIVDSPALEAKDDAAASKWLAEAGVRQSPHEGPASPDSIISHYQDNGVSARDRFVAIHYLGWTERQSDSWFLITFTDELRSAEQTHICRHQQCAGIASQWIRSSHSPGNPRGRLNKIQDRTRTGNDSVFTLNCRLKDRH